MNVNKVIFQIHRTEVPEFSDGVYKSPWLNGFVVKSTESGNLSVRYAGDLEEHGDNAPWRVLAVSGTNTWDLPDVIGEIRDHASTTITISNLLVGSDLTD